MTTIEDQARSLFLAALERGPDQWPAFLDEACGGDAGVRARVEELLRAHQAMGTIHAGRGRGQAGTVDLAPAEQPGTVIGPYRLLEQIGEGGFGVVFLAEQTQPVRREVALKVLKAGMDTRQVVARFEAERQALAIMDHPNIARVFDGGATPSGRPYFVMELVKGVPITEFCDRDHLTPRRRLELFLPVCRAVQHAHQKGIIHRDLKPSNVLVALYDGRPVPKVIDFGVAKAAGPSLTEKTLVTGFGNIVGTLEYMSPEQAGINQLDVDTRSDIYSLGVLLYELLTGSPPFTRQDSETAGMLEMLRAIREQEPTRPSTRLSTAEGLPALAANRGTEPAKLARLVRGELDWIVMKALEKERTRRYETANGLATDLQRYLADEPVQACPPSAAYRFRKFARRNKAALAMAAVVAGALVLAVVGLAVSNWLVARERDQKIQALSDKEKALASESTALAKALEQEGLANERAKEARKQQTIARAQELLARRRFYAAQMHLAMQAWEAGNPVRVLALLESQRPKVDEDDLRTFEWYYLWRLCQGGLRHSFPMINHDNAAAMALSPDGHTLATGFDQTIKLWDTRTGRETLALTGQRGQGFDELAFTPDGQSLVSGDGSTIRLWDLASGKERAVLTPGPGYSCDHVAIAGDGNTLVLGGAKLTLWDLSQGKQVGVVASGADGPYAQPAITSDGQTVATRCGPGHFPGPYVIKIWAREGDSWRERHSIPWQGWGFSAAFSPDGKTLAVSEGYVKCYEVATGEVRPTLAGQQGHSVSVGYSADGKALIAADDDKIARTWDAATGRRIANFAHPVGVHGAVLSADGKVAATAAGVIRVWDTTPPQEAIVLRHAGAVWSVAFASDGKTLATGGMDGTKLWHLGTVEGPRPQPAAEPRTILTVPGRHVFHRGVGVALSPDGKTLATPDGSGGGIAIWSTTGEKRAVLEGHTNPVSRMAISPDGKSLASVTAAPEAIVWDLGAARPRAKIGVAGEMYSIAFSPDGKWLATGSQFGVVKLFDAATCREVATLQRYEFASTWAHALAFSPDSKLLAASSQEGVVQVWEVATGRLQTTMKGHLNWVMSLGFSPDGQTLATGGADTTVKLWDVATGQERCTLKGHQGVVRALQFAPDGNSLVTGSDDGTVRLWPAAVGAEARARKKELEADVPGTPAAHNERGDALWQYGRTEEAEGAYAEAATRLEKLAATFPDSAGLRQEMIRNLLSRSLLLEQTGRPEEAGPLRARAHEIYRNLSPNDQQALIWACCERGRKLSTIQNRRQAERTYSQAIDLAPTNERARSWRSSVYAWLGEWDKVVADCSRLIELNPDDASCWNRRGVAYARLGQKDRAVADSSRAIQLKPAEPLYWSNRGTCYARLGQYDKAVADFSRAIDLDPGNPTYHYRLGAALDELGKAEEALERYGKAIELSPKDPDVRNNLGKRMLRQRAALDERAAASSRYPWERGKLASDYFRLGAAFRSLEMPVDAEAACRQALDRFVALEKEWHSVILFHEEEGWVCHVLAGLLHDRGRTEEAQPLSRKALEHFRAAALDRPDRFYPCEAIAAAAADSSLFLKQLGKPDEAAQAEGEALAARQAAEKLRKLPQAEELLARARPFAEKRRWKQAADELDRGFQGQPRSDPHLCYAAALARLLAGDMDGYASLIERMPKGSLSNEWPHDPARIRTLHPRGAADPGSLVTLAQAAYDWQVNSWSAQNLGMALYRAEKFDEALPHLEEATKLAEWYIHWPALAMAHHQLGHADEARQWLDKANDYYRHVVETSSEPLKVTKDVHWQDWAYFELLRREANALIGRENRRKEDRIRSTINEAAGGALTAKLPPRAGSATGALPIGAAEKADSPPKNPALRRRVFRLSLSVDSSNGRSFCSLCRFLNSEPGAARVLPQTSPLPTPTTGERRVQQDRGKDSRPAGLSLARIRPVAWPVSSPIARGRPEPTFRLNPPAVAGGAG
jgi:WD40 repeat protein/serine/threonine protein kinase/tetratricopeptide (TPR) repeat protein